MKRLWIVPAAVIGLVACASGTKATPQAGGRMTPAVIEPYLKIQDALAHDSTEGVRANAGNIATAASGLGAPAVKIDMAAVSLTAAADLADARERFGTLSDAIVDYMTGLHLQPPDGVHTAYCSMVKKPWLQQGTTLANPYYGSEMLTCGELR